MAIEKNIREVETTEADFVANAEAKNDGFLTDDAGYPMVKRRGTGFDFWYPEKHRDNLGNYTYFNKAIANLIATGSVSIGDKLQDVDDSDLNIQFDSVNSQIIINIGGSPVATFKSTGIEFSNGWELVVTADYWALYKDSTYSGFGIGSNIPETLS